MTRINETKTAITDLAARYLTAWGNITRFSSAGNVWAFTGFDLVVDNSDDRCRVGSITNKGFPRIKTFRPRSAWIAKSAPVAYQVSGKPLDLAIQREQVKGLFSWNLLTS